MDKTLKRRLAARELTIGSWMTFPYTLLAEMLVRAGFEWVVVDMEHTAIGVSDAQQLIQVIELGGASPLVRVGENAPLLIKRSLDAGAHGILVPNVNDAAEAERAVAATRYAPAGTRGAGLARAHGYGLGFEEYRQWLEKECVVVVQIEHPRAVENIDEILAVEGVNAFIVGPYDLSCAMGRPGEFQHPDVLDALEHLRGRMREGGKPGGYHVVNSNHDELLRRVEEGYRFLAYGDDMVFFAEKLRDESEFIRNEVRVEQERGLGPASKGES